MDQIENTAIQTFSMVPEVYQQVFIQAGADFPDELVAQIKQDPNQAIELLNSDKALKNAVVTIFKNNQETIMNAINKQTGMFKSGGKLAQGLQKFQSGGSISVDPKSVKQANKNTYKAPDYRDVTHRHLGYSVDKYGNKYITESGVVNGNSASTTVVASPTDTLVQQRIFRGERGDLNKTYPRGTSEYESVMRRIRPWFNIFGQ